MFPNFQYSFVFYEELWVFYCYSAVFAVWNKFALVIVAFINAVISFTKILNRDFFPSIFKIYVW